LTISYFSLSIQIKEEKKDYLWMVWKDTPKPPQAEVAIVYLTQRK